MIVVITGDTVLLELVLADGDTTRFPQAEVYGSAGVAIGASPVNLSHVADGLYQGTFTAPAVGEYSIIYITYSDVVHTTIVANVERVSEHMRVTNAVQDDVWSELLPGAFGAGTAGNIVGNNVDATISSRSTLTQADILSDATPFAGANIDATISSRSNHTPADVDTTLSASHGAGSWVGSSISQQDVRDAMKLAPTVGVPAAGSVDEHLDTIEADTSTMEPLVSSNLDVTVSSRSTLNQSDILSDATPFAGANVDATISSRSSHTPADVDTAITASHGAGSYLTATGFAVAGDAMALTGLASAGLVDDVWDEALAGHLGVGSTGEALNDASSGAGVDWTVSERSQIRQALGVTGATLATAAGELQDILADTAAIEPLTTLNLDATVSSRSTLAQADIVADSVPFDGANVDVAISSRGTADPGDAMTLTAGERTAIDGVLTASHGAGGWTTGSAISQQDVRDAMKLAPTAGVPAAGSIDQHVDDIEADTSAIEPLTTANLDAAVSSRGTADPGDAMALTPAERTAIDVELTAAHGAGSWVAGVGLTQQDVRDSMLLSPAPGAPAAGSVDEHLDTIESDIGTLNNLSAADVENAVWDAAKTGHIAAGSLGESLTLAAAHAGVDVVLDGGAGFAAVQIDADNNLVGARLRAFGSSALANAATLGAADGADGELKRFDVTASYVNGNATPTVKVLTDMVRVVT